MRLSGDSHRAILAIIAASLLFPASGASAQQSSASDKEQALQHQKWIEEQDRKEHERQAGALQNEQANLVRDGSDPSPELKIFHITDDDSFKTHNKELSQSLDILRERFPRDYDTIVHRLYIILDRSSDPMTLARKYDPAGPLPKLHETSAAQLQAYKNAEDADKRSKAAAELADEPRAKAAREANRRTTGSVIEHNLNVLLGVVAAGAALSVAGDVVRANELSKMSPAERDAELTRRSAALAHQQCIDRQMSYGQTEYQAKGVCY